MNISFGSGTPIIAKPGSLKSLGAELAYQVENKHPYALVDLTDFFKKSAGEGDLHKAAAEGNEVGVLLTGSGYKELAEQADGGKNPSTIIQHIDRLPVVIKNKFNTVVDKLIIRVTTDK